ncbi:MAG TPA: dUTP diphosphatase [Bacteroidales bacterium]|nr:dUTP diphosphatase [Bacteroidales bacterium]
MKIGIVNKLKHKLPACSTISSSGMDVRADIVKPIVLKSLKRTLINKGLFIEIPVGYEAQIRPGSGLAIKHGITVLNSPGTIDSDYRREVCIILINLSVEDFVIKVGERICQMVVAKHEMEEWMQVDTLDETDRSVGGFVHTGKI